METDVRIAAEDRREGEAVRNARQRIAVLADSVGPRHPDYATGLNQLALLLIMQGDPDSAEPLLRQALAIRKETLGDAHPDYATNLSSLGGLLWARGELQEAEPLLRGAAEIRVATLGAAHPKTIVSQNSLEQLFQAKRASRDQRASTEEPAATRQPEVDRAPPAEVEAPTDPGPSEHSPNLAEDFARLDEPEVIPETPKSQALAEEEQVEEAEAIPETPEPQALAEEEQVEEAEADLAGWVESVREEFSAVGEALLEAVGRLRSHGAVPSLELLSRARDTGKTFRALVGAANREAGEFGIAPDPADLVNLVSVEKLATRIETAAESRRRGEEARREVLPLLARVDRLSCLSDPDFPALVACKSKMSDLRDRVTTGPPDHWEAEESAFRQGSHPVLALLHLVEADEQTPDAIWADWFDRVEADFGTPLAVAAARSRFTLSAP